MRHRLVVLAALTGATLLCIIGLQGFWLRSSFLDQKRRLKADVSNALATVILKDRMGSLIAGKLQQGESSVATQMDLSGAEVNSILTSLKPGGSGQLPHAGGQVLIRVATEPGDSLLLQRIREKGMLPGMAQIIGASGADTSGKAGLLAKYKALLAEELRIRATPLPFEMALIDATGMIRQSTIDTARFRSIRFATAPNECGADGYRLQAALPGVDRFLIGRMGWLLGSSAMLVLICLCSFTYLIILFFREKRYAALRNDFMNNMTHELKTPISSVSVALELLEDERKPLSQDTRREYFGAARGELSRLSLLVDKVLKMAAFERSEIRLECCNFPAESWMAEVLRGLRPLLDRSGAQLEIAILPPDLGFYADPAHLANVMQNLIENAVKYNDKARLSIQVGISTDGGEQLISVRDNGRGIPAIYLEKVFEKFFRVPSGDRHDIKGYGLGLSYVKAIVALHRGRIDVSSRVGTGTTFTIHLPLCS